MKKIQYLLEADVLKYITLLSSSQKVSDQDFKENQQKEKKNTKIRTLTLDLFSNKIKNFFRESLDPSCPIEYIFCDA